MVFLAFYGTMVGDLFNSWEQAGFFQYLFPVLLLFALVFGILTKLDLFKDNKGLNAIIALVVGLIAIQSSFVSEFFNALFPRLGIGLIILLSVILVAGLVLPKTGDVAILMISAIIIIMVLVNTAGALGWSSSSWWSDNWTTVVGLVLIVALVIAIIVGNSNSKEKFAGESILGQLIGRANK